MILTYTDAAMLAVMRDRAVWLAYNLDVVMDTNIHVWPVIVESIAVAGLEAYQEYRRVDNRASEAWWHAVKAMGRQAFVAM